jgi:hypothetical protein
MAGPPVEGVALPVTVRIGVTYSAKEIEVELPNDTDRDDIKARVDAAIASASGVLWLPDRKGRDVAVPADKIAFVEIGSGTDDRRIGFAG